jgi:hypothetical protein
VPQSRSDLFDSHRNQKAAECPPASGNLFIIQGGSRIKRETRGMYQAVVEDEIPVHHIRCRFQFQNQCQQLKAEIDSFSDIFIYDISCLPDSAPLKLLTLVSKPFMQQASRSMDSMPASFT